MDKSLPTSFMGYKKESVNQILKEKDERIKTQQGDINYLRKEVEKLEKKLPKNQ